MSVKVYACMVESTETNKFLGFIIAKDVYSKQEGIEKITKRMQSCLSPKKRLYGKVFMVEKRLEVSRWL